MSKGTVAVLLSVVAVVISAASGVFIFLVWQELASPSGLRDRRCVSEMAKYDLTTPENSLISLFTIDADCNVRDVSGHFFKTTEARNREALARCCGTERQIIGTVLNWKG